MYFSVWEETRVKACEGEDLREVDVNAKKKSKRKEGWRQLKVKTLAEEPVIGFPRLLASHHTIFVNTSCRM